MQRSLGVLLIILLAGCGHSIDSRKDYSNNYIQGTVSVNGKPLTAGSVTFIAENGQKFTGYIWRDGRYEVSRPKPGLAKVVLNGEVFGYEKTAPGGNAGAGLPPARKVKLPPQYLSEKTTPLEYQIKTTHQEHDINLEIDPAEWIKLNPGLAPQNDAGSRSPTTPTSTATKSTATKEERKDPDAPPQKQPAPEKSKTGL